MGAVDSLLIFYKTSRKGDNGPREKKNEDRKQRCMTEGESINLHSTQVTGPGSVFPVGHVCILTIYVSSLLKHLSLGFCNSEPK